MSTEERDESQPRPRKVIPSIRRENTESEGDRRPYNQGGYGRQEGNNYERRPYNQSPRDDRGGYRSSNYGDYQNRPRQYDNRDGGYSRPRQYDNRDGGGYNRPSYGNNYDRSYGGNQYNNRQGGGYDNRPVRAYSSNPSGEGASGDIKKRRPRVGDARTSSYDNPQYGNRPSYGNNNRQGGYGNNSYGNNRQSGGYNNNRQQGGYGNRPPQRRTGNYNPNAKYNFQKQLKYKEVLADPNEPIRLNKFLANAGVCSRREADEFIQAGVVKVNDVVVTELGTKITRQDKVEFQDRQVQIESKVYIVLNKPKNCVTTSDDPQERLTVMDLVKNACKERIYPVGRLDRNTTGVLLLTNDGDLASKLTHPSLKKKKIYHVWLDKNVAIEDMEKIANGIELEDGEIHADAISYANEMDKSQVGIEIHSGRNRIVRRIFESLGYHVTKLDRVYFAGLTKKNLSRGKWRYLNEREVNALRMGAFE
ncbi:pseudouridine synthase [Massilibacteroides sp.]|uniref:pseudouridine synthase n=1 Tax=Massilibacteroides sp. TaxID=2034766 RepID=UPI002633AA91|nr:pseudouridine synthase [Massilibacteroides sp.]MDD4516208.1 pseudouridine synthase [Massilibacteroides sp.]